MWFVGLRMWLGIEQKALAAWNRGLRLVSLNQLRNVSLERFQVFTLGAYGSALVFGSGASRDLYMLYVQRMVYISRFFTMVFIGFSLKGELVLDITYTFGMEQGSYFFIWKLFTMTLISEFGGFFASWWLVFKGLIKSDFAKLSGVLFIFFK